MSSMERIEGNAARVGHALLLAIFSWIGWRALQRGEWRLLALLLVPVCSSILTIIEPVPIEGRETAKGGGPSAWRMLLVIGMWAGLGSLIAYPGALMPSHSAESRLRDWIPHLALLLIVGSPALALLHLHFLSAASDLTKARLKWRIVRLGPLGACAYLLGAEDRD